MTELSRGVASCVLVATAAELACSLKAGCTNICTRKHHGGYRSGSALLGGSFLLLLGAFFFRFYEIMTYGPKRVQIDLLLGGTSHCRGLASGPLCSNDLKSQPGTQNGCHYSTRKIHDLLFSSRDISVIRTKTAMILLSPLFPAFYVYRLLRVHVFFSPFSSPLISFSVMSRCSLPTPFDLSPFSPEITTRKAQI